MDEHRMNDIAKAAELGVMAKVDVTIHPHDILGLLEEIGFLKEENDRLKKVEEEFKQYIPYLYAHGFFQEKDDEIEFEGMQTTSSSEDWIVNNPR